MVFVVLRQQDHTIQGLVVVEPEAVSKKMVRWVESINDESIVLVEGVVQKAKEPVKSCTVHEVELKIRKVRTVRIKQKLDETDDNCADPPHLGGPRDAPLQHERRAPPDGLDRGCQRRARHAP